MRSNSDLKQRMGRLLPPQGPALVAPSFWRYSLWTPWTEAQGAPPP